MPSIGETVKQIRLAASWDSRVSLIRRIPEDFGRATHQAVFAAIAENIYVPLLTPDFAYVHEHPAYTLENVRECLDEARAGTDDFSDVSVAKLRRTLEERPSSLRCFRLIVGYTPQELAATTKIVAAQIGADPVPDSRVKSMEQGGSATPDAAIVLAETIDRAVRRELFPEPGPGLLSKQNRVDLVDGWASVRQLLTEGVPYEMFLHQRHYGGAFRQLLDATSTKRGDVLEDAVSVLFDDVKVSYLRTGSRDQGEVSRRFKLTVKPSPDFVVHDQAGTPKALLECKTVNDGGTARDKAARFASLRAAGQSHGGIPVFGILGGLGWTRVNDALGPVVQACDGRVFTLTNLAEMLDVSPFPSLITENSPR